MGKNSLINQVYHIIYGAHYYAVYTVTTRAAILNINQEANWQFIKQGKQAFINKGNQKENCCRQSHVYCAGGKVLLQNAWKTKFNQDAYIGPYTMTEVWNNGAACTLRGNVTDTYNMCNITAFKE